MKRDNIYGKEESVLPSPQIFYKLNTIPIKMPIAGGGIYAWIDKLIFKFQ